MHPLIDFFLNQGFMSKCLLYCAFSLSGFILLIFLGGEMRHTKRIQCFTFLTLLLVTLCALPAFANYALKVTVNTDNSPSYVEGYGDICFGTCVSTCTCSILNEPFDYLVLVPFPMSGIDSTGNYDCELTSVSGCPTGDLNNGNCTIQSSNTGNVSVVYNFQKVYGLPSQVSVSLNGNG